MKFHLHKNSLSWWYHIDTSIGLNSDTEPSEDFIFLEEGQHYFVFYTDEGYNWTPIPDNYIMLNGKGEVIY